jgi:mannose-6-phosphate isomerase-like protein (cupin superfamily)
MPVIHAAEAVGHHMHGSRFTSYAAPARGSAELCAWRLDVPPACEGTTHVVSREEIVFVLGGTLLVTLGDEAGEAGVACRVGDAIVVPANSSVRIDNPGGEPASAWVTTSVGLEAVLPDGSRLSPPWVR